MSISENPVCVKTTPLGYGLREGAFVSLNVRAHTRTCSPVVYTLCQQGWKNRLSSGTTDGCRHSGAGESQPTPRSLDGKERINLLIKQSDQRTSFSERRCLVSRDGWFSFSLPLAFRNSWTRRCVGLGGAGRQERGRGPPITKVSCVTKRSGEKIPSFLIVCLSKHWPWAETEIGVDPR